MSTNSAKKLILFYLTSSTLFFEGEYDCKFVVINISYVCTSIFIVLSFEIYGVDIKYSNQTELNILSIFNTKGLCKLLCLEIYCALQDIT